jgi:hypothetical protein
MKKVTTINARCHFYENIYSSLRVGQNKLECLSFQPSLLFGSKGLAYLSVLLTILYHTRKNALTNTLAYFAAK